MTRKQEHVSGATQYKSVLDGWYTTVSIHGYNVDSHIPVQLSKFLQYVILTTEDFT